MMDSAIYCEAQGLIPRRLRRLNRFSTHLVPRCLRRGSSFNVLGTIRLSIPTGADSKPVFKSPVKRAGFRESQTGSYIVQSERAVFQIFPG